MRALLPCVVLWIGTRVCQATQASVSFESAVASSTHVAGAFPASQALEKGSGYWCSAGGHAPGQTVTWTGTLGARSSAVGVKLNWAYGPGEVKILTSGDGGNFEEAACWRASSRAEASYEEVVTFETARPVKALTVVMKSPMPWGFFGLSDVALLAEPGPMMLVSGSSAPGGELCLVSSGRGVAVETCLEAIAAGTGREIFRFNEASQLESAADGTCVSLASSDGAGGGELALQDCAAAAEAGDGRSNVELAPSGQLRFTRLADHCIAAGPEGVRIQACSGAEERAAAQELFFQALVPDVDQRAASLFRGVAAVLNAALTRQGDLLARLQAAMPKLSTCAFAFESNSTRAGAAVSLSGLASQSVASGLASQSVATQPRDPAAEAIARIDVAFGVDVRSAKALLVTSADAVATALSKASRRGV